MNIKSLTLSLLIITFLSRTGFAENHFAPGLVVTNSGDTLRGLINDQEWSINPTIIQFKKSDGENVMMFTPLTIRSFSIVNGNRYFSFSDSVESSSLRTSELSEVKTPEKMKDTVFVRALILGNASLFYLKDRNEREHYLLQKNGGNITELYYKKYKYSNADGAFTAEVMGYKGQLSQLLSDCAAITSTMVTRALGYSNKDLVSIIKDYNKCMGSTMTYAEPKEKWKLNISIEGGINNSVLIFRSHASSILNGLTFGYELGYVAGAGFDVIIPRNRGKWSIYNQAMVRNFKSSDGKSSFDVSYDLIYVKLATTLRYHFVNRKVKPFFELGVTNAYAVKSSGDATYNANQFFSSFRKYDQGLVGGFGSVYKSFSLQLMYELSNGMSETPAIKSTFRTTYFEVGYIF